MPQYMTKDKTEQVTLNNTDWVELQQAASPYTVKKFSILTLLARAWTYMSSLATKSTPDGTDIVGLYETGGTNKSITIANLATYFGAGIGNPAGLIAGGLMFNTTALPPKIRSGSYHVLSGLQNLTEDYALALSDLIGDQAHRLNFWYWVMMDASGNKKIQLACAGTAQKTYTINSISGSNTINVSSSSGGVQPATGMVAVITGATTATNNGFWPIASVTGSPVTAITVSGSLTNQASSGGTVKIYYAMDTYHGAGSLAGFVGGSGNTSPLIYSPSMLDAEVGWSAHDHAQWDASKNGYYSLFSGYTDYRIIGAYSVNNSGNVQDIISYKTGKNKNDNWYNSRSFSSWITNAMRWGTLYRAWGNDYLFTDDGTNASKATAKRVLKYEATMTVFSDNAGYVTIEKNGTNTIQSGEILSFTDTLSVHHTVPALTRLSVGEYIKSYLNGTAPGSGASDRFNMCFTII